MNSAGAWHRVIGHTLALQAVLDAEIRDYPLPFLFIADSVKAMSAGKKTTSNYYVTGR